MLIQMGLTFVLLVAMGLRRAGELRADPSLWGRIGLDTSHYSEGIQKLANNFQNQFQVPVLFYVACIMALLFSVTGPVMGALAWGFVITRVGHTIVHTTSNIVRIRAALYFLGVLLLVAMWVLIALGAEQSVWFRAQDLVILEGSQGAP